MKLRNPFQTLAWNSLWLRSQSRARRRPFDFAPLCPAAQVLEVRTMLSGNVGLNVAGTAITLTSDAGDNIVEVFRLDAAHVEVHGIGTTINGQATQILNLASVSGITVNQIGRAHV